MLQQIPCPHGWRLYGPDELPDKFEVTRRVHCSGKQLPAKNTPPVTTESPPGYRLNEQSACDPSKRRSSCDLAKEPCKKRFDQVAPPGTARPRRLLKDSVIHRILSVPTNPESLKQATANQEVVQVTRLGWKTSALLVTVLALIGGCSGPDEEADSSAPTTTPATNPAGQPVADPAQPVVSPTPANPATGNPTPGNGPVATPSGSEFRSAAIGPTQASEAYASFVADHMENCGSSIRVVSDQLDSTVSEGIAYGMLMAVAHNDQTNFDGLWQYYQNNTNDIGVMHWKRRGCAGTPVFDHGASDADLDAAMALIQADCKWGGYSDAADHLLTVIREFETATANGLRLLKPGDRFGGPNCLNPGYFAPGYYRAFARYQPDRANIWEGLREDTYTLYDRMAEPNTGLLPDWADQSGAPGPACAMEIQATDATGAFGSNFAYDAARAPWRIATDFVWWQEPRAQALLQKMTNTMIQNGGPSELGDTYSLVGERLASNKTSVFSGAFTLAAMAHSQAAADDFGQVFFNEGREVKYFDSALRSVFMLLASGLFSSGCAR